MKSLILSQNKENPEPKGMRQPMRICRHGHKIKKLMQSVLKSKNKLHESHSLRQARQESRVERLARHTEKRRELPPHSILDKGPIHLCIPDEKCI